MSPCARHRLTCNLGWYSKPSSDLRHHFRGYSSTSEVVPTSQSEPRKLFVGNEKIGVLLIGVFEGLQWCTYIYTTNFGFHWLTFFNQTLIISVKFYLWTFYIVQAVANHDSGVANTCSMLYDFRNFFNGALDSLLQFVWLVTDQHQKLLKRHIILLESWVLIIDVSMVNLL